MSVLHRPTLVLNRNWQAINIVNVARALIMLWNESVRVVDPENYTTLTWEDWSKLRPEEDEQSINAVKTKICVPEVVVLLKYDKLPQATMDSVQVIADMYNLFFTFAQKRKKMMLVGIGTPYIRDVYIFPDGKLEESQKFLKNAPQYILNPGANHKLEKWEESPE